MLNDKHTFDNEKFTSPVKDMVAYVHKFDLNEVVSSLINSASQKLSGTIKHLVRNKVYNIEYRRWRASCILYPKLNIYMAGVLSIRTHICWVLVHRYPHLFRKVSAVMALLVGSQPKYLQCFRLTRLCELCALCEMDTPEHLLLRCQAMDHIRTTYLSKLYDIVPYGMRVNTMQDHEKMIFFLSGLHCSTFVDEWSEAFMCICSFVYAVYMQRKQLYDEIDQV